LLTEEYRATLIESLQKNLNFEYQGYRPLVNVYRHGEGFDRKNPYILVLFLPSNRHKFRSISDAIGKATPLGKYVTYGYAQIEKCSIYSYCGEFPSNFGLNGRFFTEAMALTSMKYVQRNWESILWDMYCSFDRGEDMWAIFDESFYDPNIGTQIYCYRLDIYIRTPVRWDKVPVDYDEEEDVLETVHTSVGSTNGGITIQNITTKE